MIDDWRGKTRAWEGEADVGVVLGGVEGVGGDEDWGIVAFDHAVVEEEVESGSSWFPWCVFERLSDKFGALKGF